MPIRGLTVGMALVGAACAWIQPAEAQISTEMLGAASENAAPATIPQGNAFDRPPMVESSPSAGAPYGLATENPIRQALADAYVNNPRLKAEREALKINDEDVALAASGFRPTIVADYEKGRQRLNSSTTARRYGDTMAKDLTIDQPLFSGGSTIAQIRAAKQRVKAARATYLSVEQQVLLDAATAYSDTLQRQAELNLNRNNLDVLKRQLEATSARFDVGGLTRTDVEQARARVARAEADLRQADANLKSAQAAYLQVTGVMPQALDTPDIPANLPDSVDKAIEIAQGSNPDLVAARYNEKAAKADVNARLGDILPDVSLRGSMTRTEGSRFNSNSTNDFSEDAVTVNVSVPLYQSGAEYARLRAAKNAREQALFLAHQTGNAVTQNATTAFENYQASVEVITATKSSVGAAEIALQGVRQEQEFGTRTIIDVLNAEQELFINRVALVQAERNRIVQAFTLLATLGQLTAENLGLPVDIYDPEQHYNRTWWKP